MFTDSRNLEHRTDSHSFSYDKVDETIEMGSWRSIKFDTTRKAANDHVEIGETEDRMRSCLQTEWMVQEREIHAENRINSAPDCISLSLFFPTNQVFLLSLPSEIHTVSEEENEKVGAAIVEHFSFSEEISKQFFSSQQKKEGLFSFPT